MSKIPLSRQRSELAAIRNVLTRGTPKSIGMRPAERDLLLESLDAISATLSFNERYEADFRAWFLEKHGREAE